MPADYPQDPVLIVDDEEDVLASYRMSLQCNGITNIVLCSDSRKVNDLLMQIHPMVVVLDLFMPYIKGEHLLDTINRDYPEIPVIIVTGAMNVDTAVTCMKNGAYDYMVKPVEKSRLIFGIRNAIEHRTVQKQMNILEEKMMRTSEVTNRSYFNTIITVSERMENIFRYSESIAPSPMPVLILGESGTGKELIAHAIHDASGRKGKFVTVNSAGIEETLFSDNLFGHRKGAFTGADSTRAGLIEQAAGGTLFLDEIGDLDLHSQTRLLRLIQQREYYQLGSDIPRTSDARIITATNADLLAKINRGDFRKDFYFRIKTHLIELPPLRERPEDITVLVRHFVNEAQTVLNKTISSIPDTLFNMLSTYSFPGNIRELHALVFDAVSCHSSGQLNIAPFREYLLRQNVTVPLQVFNDTNETFVLSFPDRFPQLKEIEELCIQRAFKKANGNQSLAAILLGISQSTLSRRLKTMTISAS